MGVSGSGKSTLGSLLSKALGVPFLDGDDFHPESNVKKMSSGIALTDEDRWPWLEKCAEAMLENGNSVLACSSLKRSYRDKIRELVKDVVFVHLDGTKELLTERMSRREGHFMKKDMLESQLATLEKLQPDEAGFTVNIQAPEDELLENVLELVSTKK
jgi:carbohydrate kinase (thermoresistant glucokinase family)